MMTENTRRRHHVFLLTCCLVLAVLPLNGVVAEPLAATLKITLTVFALARGLNAVISVAQGTELSIEPMGVGMTLTPGQILDPLNDLVEQFSAVLLLASASLGIQNIVLLFGDSWLVRGVLLLLVVLSFWSLWRLKSRRHLWALRLLVGLTLLRLAVPVLALTTYYVQNGLAEERHQAVQVLETTRDEVQLLNSEAQTEDPSWLDKLRDNLKLSRLLGQITDTAEKGVEAAVYLIAEFILLSLLLPLLFLYLLVRLMRSF